MILTITKERMCKDINLYLTGVAESIQDTLNLALTYILVKDWVNEQGKTLKLCITGKELIEAYNACDTDREISWLKSKNSTFTERFWRYIKDI